MVLSNLDRRRFGVRCVDGNRMLELPDKSIKLVYGSPPHPNAERNYGMWRSGEYVERIAPS